MGPLESGRLENHAGSPGARRGAIMTKTNRLGFLLTVVNLIFLIALLAQAGDDAIAGDDAAVLRGRSLELVDSGGKVRAQITVEPNGEAVFRMRDASGAIRVKLGAGNNGSGLLLLDETTEPGVQIVARRSATASGVLTTSIGLNGANGQRRVIAP